MNVVQKLCIGVLVVATIGITMYDLADPRTAEMKEAKKLETELNDVVFLHDSANKEVNRLKYAIENRQKKHTMNDLVEFKKFLTEARRQRRNAVEKITYLEKKIRAKQKQR